MSSTTDFDADWTPEAKANMQQEFGWSGAALFEQYNRFLSEGRWAEPGETIVEAFVEWARQTRPAR